MGSHSECVHCDCTPDIVCPLCGEEQPIPPEEKWTMDIDQTWSLFTKCHLCECEMYVTREISYCTEFTEDEEAGPDGQEA